MTASVEATTRGLIRSMLLTGSAQALSIILSIVRMKVLAVLLGPSGVGLFSIYVNLTEMITQTAGLGMGSSGVREIASARGEEATLSRVRRVLFAAHLVQGTLALLAVWLLRLPISTWLFGDAAHATEVGLVGVAILLGLLAATQTALLQGLRHIGDLSRVTVFGAAAATAAGLGAVWGWGELGLIWFLVAQPLATVLVAVYFTRQLPKPTSHRLTPQEIWHIWKPMARLGVAFMLGGIATTGTLLLVRGRISQELGLEAAGHFAAAWGITMTYVGFLLSAMGTDYYPRLAEVIKNNAATSQLINDQMQLGLAIGGPILLLMLGWAPWIIHLFYSKEFDAAVSLLQWQTVGNVFKLAGWPLGFSNIAAGRASIFFFSQISFNVIFLLIVWPTLGSVGIYSAGPAFITAYVVGFVINITLVRRYHSFRMEHQSRVLLWLHAGLAVALLTLALAVPIAAALAAPILALATGVFGLRVILAKLGLEGRVASRFARLYAAIGWPIRSKP